MPSNIDPTKPTSGNAYTADVRQNFITAAAEISTLQDDVAALQAAVTTLQTQLETVLKRLEGGQ